MTFGFRSLGSSSLPGVAGLRYVNSFDYRRAFVPRTNIMSTHLIQPFQATSIWRRYHVPPPVQADITDDDFQ